MRCLLLASNNAHKREEIEGIIRLLDVEIEVSQPRDLGFAFDVVEHGTTFAENALAKALGLSELIRGRSLEGVTSSLPADEVSAIVLDHFNHELPYVIADDSGICVHALDNAPGVYSARFGADDPEPPRDDDERNSLLLKRLSDRTDRGAHYVCNAVLVLSDDEYIQAESPWYGAILRERYPGDTGFGYDPIVWMEEYGRSVAQMSQAQKNVVSHRAKAIRRLLRGADLL